MNYNRRTNAALSHLFFRCCVCVYFYFLCCWVESVYLDFIHSCIMSYGSTAFFMYCYPSHSTIYVWRGPFRCIDTSIHYKSMRLFLSLSSVVKFSSSVQNFSSSVKSCVDTRRIAVEGKIPPISSKHSFRIRWSFYFQFQSIGCFLNINKYKFISFWIIKQK